MTANGTTSELTGTVGWRLSRHAREMCLARGFPVRDVLLAAAHPQIAYTQDDYGIGRRMHQRGEVAVVVDIDSMTIVTVLWRHVDPWTDGHARMRSKAAA